MTCSDDRTLRLWNPHKDDPAREDGNALQIKTYRLLIIRLETIIIIL